VVALADNADMAARLGRALSTDETAAVAGLITEASVLVVGYLRRDWTALADVPEAVRVVVSRMAARALTGASNLPAGAESYGSSLSVMSHTVKLGPDVVTGSVWLSRVDKTTLAPHVRRPSIVNMPMY
jgi:hypothetical protein